MPSSTVKRVPRRASGSGSAASEASSSGNESDAQTSSSPSPFEGDQGSQDSGSESDHLDSVESRKRRRVVPAVKEVEEDAPVVSIVSVPSRIKRRSEHRSEPRAEPQQQLEEPPKTVLAPTDPNTTFESLNVRPWLVRSLGNMAIKRPTGIQKGCIPEILKGRDCIGGSRTGSGKTVAFAVPILQKWAEDPSAIFAVVLTPTR